MAQMFLRTALTERRIEHLEKKMEFLFKHLELEMPQEPDDFDNFPPQSVRHPPSIPPVEESPKGKPHAHRAKTKANA